MSQVYCTNLLTNYSKYFRNDFVLILLYNLGFFEKYIVDGFEKRSMKYITFYIEVKNYFKNVLAVQYKLKIIEI